jgi:hypothetical protein
MATTQNTSYVAFRKFARVAVPPNELHLVNTGRLFWAVHWYSIVRLATAGRRPLLCAWISTENALWETLSVPLTGSTSSAQNP